ncbi:MFS transporter [Metabacillus litoralis]|uniref:MFS transporter n=1 Tax=Metabacillus litoralis TaxID=152268 RepID=A0A5C6W0F2_9BACI|nr:MFS transporter [Metabacillus litoralis]TXC91133.1 MFS transporter [Metabacillus litoralis]
MSYFQQVIQHNMAPIKTKFYYGWIIVALSAMGVFFSGPGQTYTISLFIDQYIKEFGWSRSTVSSIYSAATLLAGILLFLVGRLIDKYGQRKMVVIIGSMLALACFWNSFVSNMVMLFIGFFLIRLFGQGSMTLLPNTLVPQWFIKYRGRAFSFMAIGGFISSAAFPIINAWLITTFDWQTTWTVWGILLLVIFVPVAYVFTRNKPEDIGLLPDDATVLKRTGQEVQEDETILEENWTLKEARKTIAFWLLLFIVAIPALVNTGLTFHLVSILGEGGIKPAVAALILSLMAIIGFPITFISGFILERVKVNILLAIVFIGEIFMIIIIFFTDSIPMAILFGVVWGITGGLERITLAIVWPSYFGRKHIGSIKGVAMTMMVIGSAFGPLPFGVAFDMFHGYEEILLATLILPVAAAIAAISTKQPVKSETLRN